MNKPGIVTDAHNNAFCVLYSQFLTNLAIKKLSPIVLESGKGYRIIKCSFDDLPTIHTAATEAGLTGYATKVVENNSDDTRWTVLLVLANFKEDENVVSSPDEEADEQLSKTTKSPFPTTRVIVIGLIVFVSLGIGLWLLAQRRKSENPDLLGVMMQRQQNV